MNEHAIESLLTTTGLTEGELSELLEGGSVPAEKEGLLRSALAKNPEMARLLSGVRADRMTLRVMDAGTRAPAGLLEAVEIRIEQEALRTLVEPVGPAPIPIAAARTLIERRNRLEVFVARAWVRRFSAAAVWLMAIGAGVYGTYVGIVNWPSGGPSGTGESGTNVARNDSSAQNHTSPVEGVPNDSALAMVDPAAPIFTALAMTSPADGPGMAADGTVFSEAELLSLAGAGRLAIVISGDTATVPERIERAGAAGRGFRVASMGDPSVIRGMPSLALAMEREAELPRSEWAAALRDPWMLSGSGEVSAKRVVNVSAVNDPESLRSALAACGVIGDRGFATGRCVRVMVLDEPVAQPTEVDAASVLWWSASPSKWARTTTVPVIIEE